MSQRVKQLLVEAAVLFGGFLFLFVVLNPSSVNEYLSILLKSIAALFIYRSIALVYKNGWALTGFITLNFIYLLINPVDVNLEYSAVTISIITFIILLFYHRRKSAWPVLVGVLTAPLVSFNPVIGLFIIGAVFQLFFWMEFGKYQDIAVLKNRIFESLKTSFIYLSGFIPAMIAVFIVLCYAIENPIENFFLTHLNSWRKFDVTFPNPFEVVSSHKATMVILFYSSCLLIISAIAVFFKKLFSKKLSSSDREFWYFMVFINIIMNLTSFLNFHDAVIGFYPVITLVPVLIPFIFGGKLKEQGNPN